MSAHEQGSQSQSISLRALIKELENVIDQLRDVPDPNALHMEALREFQRFLDDVRNRFHENAGPRSFLFPDRGPPGHAGD